VEVVVFVEVVFWDKVRPMSVVPPKIVVVV
jgi:hypothetical protein